MAAWEAGTKSRPEMPEPIFTYILGNGCAKFHGHDLERAGIRFLPDVCGQPLSLWDLYCRLGGPLRFAGWFLKYSCGIGWRGADDESNHQGKTI